MSNNCERCGSYAINEHSNGRIKGVDSNLCDVCYWRKRAEKRPLFRKQGTKTDKKK